MRKNGCISVYSIKRYERIIMMNKGIKRGIIVGVIIILIAGFVFMILKFVASKSNDNSSADNTENYYSTPDSENVVVDDKTGEKYANNEILISAVEGSNFSDIEDIVRSYNGKIVGYIGSWIVQGEAQITNIAVDPDFRRRGIGESMLKEFESIVKNSLGVAAMTLEVRPSNLSAIHLYEKFGFRSVGRRPRYYVDNNEDAIIMWKTKI